MVWVRATQFGASSHGPYGKGNVLSRISINSLGATNTSKNVLPHGLAHNVKSIARAARGVKKNRSEKCYSLVTTSPVLAVRPCSPRALLFALQAAWIFLETSVLTCYGVVWPL